MNYFKLNALAGAVFMLVSCGDSNSSKTSGDDLTGIWRLEFNNIPYLLVEDQSVVSVTVCNSDNPFILTKSSDSLDSGGSKFINIIDKTHLEISSGDLAGTQLVKMSDDDGFNSGSFAVQSSNITDLAASSGVCAYRESDGVYNIIAAPYGDGFLQLTMGVDGMSAGELSIPSDVSLELQSEGLPGQTITASSGTVNVSVYSDTKLTASYTFTADDGNEYTGSLDVDL